MEQKQLDELEDYTEEFIEDETPEEHMVLKARRERKALAMKRLAERAAKETAEKEQLAKTAKQNLKMKATEVKMEPIKVETYTDDEITITPIKEELKSVKTAPPVEVSTPVNPWATEGKKEEASGDAGFFQDVSTWQAFTGILIILLIFSIFTQGFQFKVEGANVKSGAELKSADVSVATAGEKASGDKTAESTKAAATDATNISSVQAKETDSAATSNTDVKVSSEVQSDSANKTKVNSSSDLSTKSSSESTPSTVSETPAVSTVKTVPRLVSLGAKKWRFSSEKVTVKQNDHVVLTVRPESMSFTFEIKELGVEKEVLGTTVIEFDALEKGTFGFSCSSCEDWRGMVGTLVVE